MLSKRGDGGESGSFRRISPPGGGGGGGSGEGGGGGDDDDLRERARQLYLDNLDKIEKAATSVARSHGYSPQDTEDFCQEARLFLLDKPRVLGAYREDASLVGYLIGVLSNFALDIYRRQSGKWHTSAEAKRLGAAAEALETLRYRDNRPLELALVELLRKFPELTREQALALDEKLKPRSLRQWVGDGPLEHLVADSHADEDVEKHELEEIDRKVRAALDEALGELESFDRIMVKSIFGHNLSIKDFAALHGIKPRQGYSRFDKLRLGLRKKLDDLGIKAEEALRIIGWSESALHLGLDSDDDEGGDDNDD